MPFDSTKFYLGVNIGWLNHAYGHDLGSDFENGDRGPFPGDNDDFRDIIRAYFLHLSMRHIKVVRMWLLERLEGMGLRHPHNLFVVDVNDEFTYNRKRQTFFTRIRFIMEAAQSYGLQIYWCLLDAAGLLPGHRLPGWYRKYFRHLVSIRRSNFINDILLPFLNSINNFRNNVFAIDIANEIDWCWHRNKRILSKSAVAAFTHEIFDSIKRNTPFQCTASFASYDEMMRERVRDFNFLDFYDYHRYFDLNAPSGSNHGNLRPWVGEKLCIIGEIGHKYPHHNSPVDEQMQASSSRTLMNQALNGNYSGVFLWRYAPVGDHHRLLRIASNVSESVPSRDSRFDVFLAGFKAAAASATPGGRNPFTEYERQIWDEVEQFFRMLQRSHRNRIP